MIAYGCWRHQFQDRSLLIIQSITPYNIHQYYIYEKMVNFHRYCFSLKQSPRLYVIYSFNALMS